ncbi:uncharacterized protein [Primulina eburnea]|uniref:uncharacterized protein n=1 Tax=Primulina eburnea TaxID=1245227 RepID=UPI003C6C137F
MAGRPPRQNRNPRYANNNNANEGDNGPPPGFSLNQADLMAIAMIVATTLQGLVNPNANQPPPHPPQHGVKFHYESLRKNRCSNLQWRCRPEVSQSWLKSVETQLRLLEVPDALKVDVVVPFLDDRAGKWWEAISPAMTAAGPITWQRFREAFLKQYYPAEVRLQKLSEFENFSQTPDMSVVEYTSQFNALGLYAPAIMADEVLKLHRFKKGLNSRIQSALVVYQPTNFSDLMGAAIRAETDIQHREKECKGDRSNSGVNANKPRENKTNARVFAITQEEADDANDVVSGTIFIQQVLAYVLFDCGATHSFMSKRFAKKLGFDHGRFRHHLRDGLVSQEHAIVDCKGKKVKLITPNQEEVVYQGIFKERKSLLSASQAWRAMKSGEDIYLAMVSEVKEEVELELEDIPIVREFLDFFPEELSGTVPNREVEFEINLVPGAVPISKAPYRMELAELNELKEQLQELLDKRQIRPSVSS